LHGDEPPAFVASLRISLPQRVNIVRAFRCREASLLSVSDYLVECLALGPLPDAALLDAFKPGQYGGTGEVSDWNAIRRDRALLGSLPIILAGGLTAENVGQAIAAARPDGVDTASGVESSAGRKDPQLVRQFVSAAKAALALTSPSPSNPVPS
jgi:phosphoribosylanthranilate isomerase